MQHSFLCAYTYGQITMKNQSLKPEWLLFFFSSNNIHHHQSVLHTVSGGSPVSFAMAWKGSSHDYMEEDLLHSVPQPMEWSPNWDMVGIYCNELPSVDVRWVAGRGGEISWLLVLWKGCTRLFLCSVPPCTMHEIWREPKKQLTVGCLGCAVQGGLQASLGGGINGSIY